MKHFLITIATIAGIAIMFAVAIIIGGTNADAAIPVTMDGKPWLVARPELQNTMNNQGSWQWIICGITQPGSGQCQPGDIPSFGSYWKLAWAIEHPAGRTTFFLDQEGWTYTPKLERQHPFYYVKLAGQLAAAHHVTLIEAPVVTGNFLTIAAKRRAQLALDVTAATYASGVDIQDQWAGALPGTYRKYAIQYSTALRAAAKAAHHSVLILDNLSTDPGGIVVGGIDATYQQSADILHRSYENARPYVDGFWFETPTWTSQQPSPANCQTTGCPEVAAAFLASLGVIAAP